MPKDKADLPDLPKSSGAEVVVSFLKAGLSAVPRVGSPAGELLGLATSLAVSKRMDDWLDQLAQAVVTLREQYENVTPESLAANEAFITTLLHATQAALRNHQREKLDALRNAVLNAALPNALDDSLQLTFLSYIEALTHWHIQLLQAIADPLAWAKQRNYPIYQPQPNIDVVPFFKAVHRGRLPVEGFERVLVTDLYNRGLATTGVDPYGPLVPRDQGSTVPHLTELGRQFLAYVASPLLEESYDAASAPGEGGTSG